MDGVQVSQEPGRRGKAPPLMSGSSSAAHATGVSSPGIANGGLLVRESFSRAQIWEPPLHHRVLRTVSCGEYVTAFPPSTWRSPIPPFQVLNIVPQTAPPSFTGLSTETRFRIAIHQVRPQLKPSFQAIGGKIMLRLANLSSCIPHTCRRRPPGGTHRVGGAASTPGLDPPSHGSCTSANLGYEM